MKNHILERQQYLPAPMQEVFAFFSDIRNLEWLTPSWLGFRIVTSEKVEMKAGAQIDFIICLAGLPVRWRTRIAEWAPGVRFVDEQVRGPYAFWRHEHRFEPFDGGVLMTDRVCYRLPLGVLGRVLHRVAVRGALTAIFDYRFQRIRERFDGNVVRKGPRRDGARASSEQRSPEERGRRTEGGEWWPRAESNRRHADFQSAALPTELPGRKGNGSYQAVWECQLQAHEGNLLERMGRTPRRNLRPAPRAAASSSVTAAPF